MGKNFGVRDVSEESFEEVSDAFNQSIISEPLDANHGKQFRYEINGIHVYFPFEAYECQLQMMREMITSLTGSKQHALLESPTGSGKSMSILCAVLAWQKHVRDLMGPSLPFPDHPTNEGDFYEYSNESFTPQPFSDAPSKGMKSGVKGEKKKGTGESESSHRPKVYIASRTHRQIAQLVKELSRTAYRPKFVVLGSRNHYCINQKVQEEATRPGNNINDLCKNAVGDRSSKPLCGYFKRIDKFNAIYGRGYTPNVDIEDLVKLGKEKNNCPYFASRYSMESAEVVFAPYNYLIDPSVRSAMGINLHEKDVVIVDEAHNIEDVCRGSGSFEIDTTGLQSIQLEINRLLSESKKKEDAGCVDLDEIDFSANSNAIKAQAHVVSLLINWIKNKSILSKIATVRKEFESAMYVWNGQSIVEEFAALGITFPEVKKWAGELDTILESKSSTDPNSMSDDYGNSFSMSKSSSRSKNFGTSDSSTKTLSSTTCNHLKGMYRVLEYVLDPDLDYLSSYRLVRYSTTVFLPKESGQIYFGNSGPKITVETMGFWCLNPEVIFEQLTDQVNSVILASGTLSPMGTFSSELGTSFRQLEAQHVIDKSQTWIGCLPKGPSGIDLLGNYSNMDTFAYQDDICEAIDAICRTIPAGVLCFVPSYAFMEKLQRRLKASGVGDSLNKIKEIMWEPRSGSPEDFDTLMSEYYEKIKTGRGVLLFAVYRGKISEGIDLKDDNCRAVIPIGIPYPAFKDPRVVLKKEFNDQSARVLGRRLMSGQEWYNSQAFRALNQALGRCIRHRQDWGAIILLDQRFTFSSNISSLSKWARSRVTTQRQFPAMLASLAAFVAENTRRFAAMLVSTKNDISFSNQDKNDLICDSSSESCKTRSVTCKNDVSKTGSTLAMNSEGIENETRSVHKQVSVSAQFFIDKAGKKETQEILEDKIETVEFMPITVSDEDFLVESTIHLDRQITDKYDGNSNPPKRSRNEDSSFIDLS